MTLLSAAPWNHILKIFGWFDTWMFSGGPKKSRVWNWMLWMVNVIYSLSRMLSTEFLAVAVLVSIFEIVFIIPEKKSLPLCLPISHCDSLAFLIFGARWWVFEFCWAFVVHCWLPSLFFFSYGSFSSAPKYCLSVSLCQHELWSFQSSWWLILSPLESVLFIEV